jgi:hypothetical protein
LFVVDKILLKTILIGITEILSRRVAQFSFYYVYWVVCPSSIYQFWLYLWYFHTLPLCGCQWFVENFPPNSINMLSIRNSNMLIMKTKFKQWWSTNPPISTKWTITSHLNSLNIKKKYHDIWWIKEYDVHCTFVNHVNVCVCKTYLMSVL